MIKWRIEVPKSGQSNFGQEVNGQLVIDDSAKITNANGQTYIASTAPVIINTGAAGYGAQENQKASSGNAAMVAATSDNTDYFPYEVEAGAVGIYQNEDGTYSYTLKKRTMSGTYTFDDKEKTITMKGKLGVKTVAHVTVTGNDMSLVFNADKLMSVLKTITGTVSKVNSTAATINSVAGSYDGLMLGFDLKK